MTPVTDNPLRKAAVFVRSLSPDAAAVMLGRLSSDEARALRAAVAELDEIDDGERAAVAQQLRQHRPDEPRTAVAPVSTDGAVELHLSAPAMKPTPPRPVAAPQPLDGAEWLRSLRDADPQAIADYLSSEQPRAIAVVLGYLSPELAAGVVQCLPEAERALVVTRLAAQDEADPDSLRVITAGLSDWVSRQQQDQQRRSTRIATIRQILTATPVGQREALLEGLAAAEPEIAASLADLRPKPEPPAAAPAAPSVDLAAAAPPAPRPTIAFDDLPRFDGRALAEAVATLDGRTALLALAGASDALVNQLASGLPRHVARDLRSRLHRVGPTTLAEIDRAQLALTAAVEAVAARRRSRLTLSTAGV